MAPTDPTAPSIAYELGEHDQKAVILIRFAYDKALVQQVKQLVGARWSSSKRVWYVPDTPQYRDKFGLAQNLVGKAVLAHIHPINHPAMATYIETLQLKGYSPNTIGTYRNEFAQLLYTMKHHLVDDLDADRLRGYFLYCINKLKLSENTLHSRINAVKFYFEQVLRREKFFFEIPRPQKRHQLPAFFTAEEVAAIIKSVANSKHKAMLMLCYSTGMRVSEVVKLKTTNIITQRQCILIEQAKGKKDRLVPLSAVLLVMLRQYYREYKPSRTGYLFEGQYESEPYSTRSLQLVLAAAKAKAGVIRPGSIHALRHSFATHLLDKGTDVTMIQKLLGHNDLKTTLRYLHTTNRDLLKIISPLDDLNL
jgi:site-specific recombinase XerD